MKESDGWKRSDVFGLKKSPLFQCSQVEAHFCEGLVGAAKQTQGWVITGAEVAGGVKR